MGEVFIPRQQTPEDMNRLEATIDDYALEGRRHGQGPLRNEYERRYGEQGTGWNVIARAPQNVPEKLAYNMGLLVLDVIVTPEGDRHARAVSQ